MRTVSYTHLIPILEDTLKEYDNVSIINEDILKVDIAALAKEKNGGRPIKVVANLPYYITTPIIMGLFESHVPLESITVMVQKEVADRMQVGPGTKDYGDVYKRQTLYCIWIIDPVIAEKADCISYRPAVIMNSHVCKRIKSKNDRTVFLEKGCFSLRERCKVVGHHFRIGGPALNVSAKIKNAPNRIRLRSRKIDGLVQMSGIAFVSKGCVEIQP